MLSIYIKLIYVIPIISESLTVMAEAGDVLRMQMEMANTG
jgi:hypothetical protein